VEILEALQRLLYLCLIPVLSCWRFLIWRGHGAGGTWPLSRLTANLVVLRSEELNDQGMTDNVVVESQRVWKTKGRSIGGLPEDEQIVYLPR
jgi:hypothetical protein